jgi:hypothetical protein
MQHVRKLKSDQGLVRTLTILIAVTRKKYDAVAALLLCDRTIFARNGKMTEKSLWFRRLHFRFDSNIVHRTIIR